jgi:oligopeptide transport system substrate-binding protein
VGYITEDVNAKLNMFKDGQITDTHLEAPMLGSAMEQRWHIDRFMDGSMFYVGFNFREGCFGANANFRKALQLAYDPVEFVYKAMKEPSWLPGASLFPVYIKGVNGLFREEYPAPVHQPNAEEARRHLELARQELGLDAWPPIVLLADDTPAGTTTSEYLQAAFKRNLGLDLRIDKQIFKQRLAKSLAGEYDILISGWSPDYFDALTFGDLFASWNLNNRGRYASEEYDALVAIAQSSLDPRERMDAFGRMQEIIYEDAVMLPLYERGRSFVVNPRLEGFKRRALAPEVDYNYARIVSAE